MFLCIRTKSTEHFTQFCNSIFIIRMISRSKITKKNRKDKEKREKNLRLPLNHQNAFHWGALAVFCQHDIIFSAFSLVFSGN